MTTTKNNEHKKLNFSSEREQSQACLNSAEHEKNQGRKVLNVPNLRFPEFQGEWEKCTLEDVINFSTTRVNSSELNKDNYVSTENMLQDYQGIVKAKSVPEDVNVVSFSCGDVLISNIRPYLKKVWKATFNGGCSSDVFVLKANDNIESDYLHYVIANDKFINFVMSGTKGVKMPRGDKKQMETYSLSLPQIQEQHKIARLLSLLDERIATQNKIIDKLQSLIKGMEDNLLDNPLWKKTYLRSFMQFFSTNSLSWEQLSYEEGEIRNLHYGLIHGFQTRGINSASLPMIKNEAIPKQYTLCQVGDVAFADASEDTSEIAKSVEFADTIEGDTICGLHTIHGRDIKNRTVVGFKGFAFNSRYFHNQIKRLAQGTKVFSITANNLSSCYVYLPDFDTQKAIVKLLKAYEEKLLVSKRLLEQYEKQKQYLLRQMFI